MAPKQTLVVLGVLAQLAEAVVQLVGPVMLRRWQVVPEELEGPVVPGPCFLVEVVLVEHDECIELV